MTTKKANKNAYAQDMIRLFNLSNKTHNNSIQYFTDKFIKDIEWNINSKHQKIAELQAEQAHAVRKAKEHQEELDHGAMLKRERDIEWQSQQIEVAETLKEYFQQSSQQLFPQEHAKSEQAAEWFKKYA